MRGLVIFLSIFFTVYGLVNLYIFIRGWQAIPQDSGFRTAFAIVFWAIALSFIVGRLVEGVSISILSDVLVWVGSFWIAAMLYFFLFVVVLDLLRAANHFLPFFPAFVATHRGQARLLTAAVATATVAVVLIAGHINALSPRITRLDLAIDKKPQDPRDFRIVAASDIHLGTIVGRRRLDSLVDTINSLNADVVVLPGDIVDEDLAPVIRQNLGESLKAIRSRFGVFAITGNHEYIGGAEQACDYLAAHRVVMLRDRAVKIGGVFLVGREDRSCTRYGVQRKALPEIMAGVDRSCPVVLLDHQPFHLEEGVGEHVDLQISGHTHHGQLWPINYIIQRVYEVGWGYRKFGTTNVFVGNGVGTWGPPVRVGNRPEILDIRLRFR